MAEPLRFLEITEIADDLLLQWLDVWELSFPPFERGLASRLLRLVKQATSEHPLLAALDPDGKLVAIAEYELCRDENAAFLWYLAVSPTRRGGGLGAQVYGEVLRRVQACGLETLLFEVEPPESMADGDSRSLAERRISFYRRQGARLLTGVHYVSSAGAHLPTLPYHVMVHSFAQIGADEAFGLAKRIFGEALTQTGTVGLI